MVNADPQADAQANAQANAQGDPQGDAQDNPQGKPSVVVRVEGSVGRLTLNAPESLNALTRAMARVMDATLRAWAQDTAISAVVLDGVGRALCAGGDIRHLYDSALVDDAPAVAAFWREEYALDALIGAYPKPYIALIDGLTMGGGVGIAAHGFRRVVGDNAQVAMPETGIGFVPDVGGPYLLARAPGSLGRYLGLLGAPMDAANALYAGFADCYVPSPRIPALLAALVGHDWGEDAFADVARIVESFAQAPGAASYAEVQGLIDQAFGAADPWQAERALFAMAESGNEWAQGARKVWMRRSPSALVVAWGAIEQAAGAASLAESLENEYPLAMAMWRSPDFREGVRAAIIDKDRNPAWLPARLADVVSVSAWRRSEDVLRLIRDPVNGLYRQGESQ